MHTTGVQFSGLFTADFDPEPTPSGWAQGMQPPAQ